MKLFFISDIHGSAFYLKKALEKFEEEKADYLVILGDELYHGARNPFPEGYSTIEVTKLLNEYKEKIIAIRGNCDSEVDQIVLEYPMMADYSIVLYNGRRLFLTHGHLFDENNLPNLSCGDVLIHGHTHVVVAKKVKDVYIINPGSISLPKEEWPNSYGVLSDDVFRIMDFDGNVVKQITLE